MQAMVFSFLALAIGFLGVVFGADRFVEGAAKIARALGISELVIGLTLVGIGSSAPEILVSVLAASQGNPGLAVGNAVGSNVANIGLVIGITALIRAISLQGSLARREFPVMLTVMFLATFLMLDRQLDRIDGAVMLGTLAVLIHLLLRGAKPAVPASHTATKAPDPAIQSAWRQALMGLILLLVGSQIVVVAATRIATALGVGDLVIGLTIVAFGTSLPEVAASVASAVRGKHDIAIGNVLGSNVVNMLAVLGCAALIRPVAISEDVLLRDLPIMLLLSIILGFWITGILEKGKIGRPGGVFFLGSYISYLVFLYLDTNGGPP